MKILFQGDSITDAGRSRENDSIFGYGYAMLVKSALGYSEPGKHEFINRGINGNRIVDIYARIKKDIINIKPDVMSMLVGVNDVCYDFSDSKNGVDADKYFKIYDMLIGEVLEALPNIKIMIMEPFIFSDSEVICKEVRKRAMMAKKLADKYGLTFIALQEGFDKLCEKADKTYWLADGVHPTPMGHEYIKNQWLEAFETL